MYFEDLGLRNAQLSFRQIEDNHIVENIIFNELKYRGFNVDVGVVLKRTIVNDKTERKYFEVDFVANLGRKNIKSKVHMTFITRKNLNKKQILLII